MKESINRRTFFQRAAVAGTFVAAGELGFLAHLPPVSAAEADLDPAAVRFGSDIEPVVRLLEETPRERLLEEVAARIHRGLTYKEVLAALLLAGVRNIQPRPVGFKFHAVLVVNSAHLASISSPEQDRWLPIFWALDEFKSSQARDAREGDWTMASVEESKVPSPEKAKAAFIHAMDDWDVAATDVAVAGLARSAKPQEIFDLFCRYGARDFRDIGHKAIYVANSWRTLQAVGWQHAEPVLRSLAYALLAHEGDNPAQRDAAADRHGRRNQEMLSKISGDWKTGKPSREATADLLQTLRAASSEDACDKLVQMVNGGLALQSVWDGLFDFSSELLFRRPGIVALHAVTSTNAIHFAFQNTADEQARKYLLLQNAAFLTQFRGTPDRLKPGQIENLEPRRLKRDGAAALEEIFAEVSRDRMQAAEKALAYLKETGDAKGFIDTARRYIFLKGTNSHDYKFSSAVLEDYYNVSPQWRDRFLAASVFNLRGSGGDDNGVVRRTRAALDG